MDEENKAKRIFMHALAGAAGGLIMSIVILFMIQQTYFSWLNLSFWIVLAASCILPLCMNPLWKTDLKVSAVELIAVGVSAVICVLYAMQAGSDAATQMKIVKIILCAHSCALIAVILYHFVFKRKRKDYR